MDDGANLAAAEFARLKVVALQVIMLITKFNRVPTLSRLEARKSTFITAFLELEESIQCAVQTVQGLVNYNRGQVGISTLIVVLVLCVARQIFTCCLEVLPPLGKRVIIHLARAIKYLQQGLLLFFIRTQAVLKYLVHALSIAQESTIVKNARFLMIYLNILVGVCRARH